VIRDLLMIPLLIAVFLVCVFVLAVLG